MPFSWRVALVTVIGLCVTIILPIAAAIEIGRRQALEVENRFVLGQAQAALLRSEVTGAQLARARDAMHKFDRPAACSDSGLDLMRELDLSSTMLQGVGFVESDQIVCSSFGGRRDYALGPAYYTSANGSIFRRNVKLGTSGEPYVVVQTGASAGVVHKDLALSFVEEVPGSAISVFSWSRRLPVLQRGTVPRSFITRNYQRDTIFRSGGSTIAVVKSARFDLGAIAIVPSANAAAFTRQAVMVMVPVGLASALLFSALFLRVMRARSSMRGLLRAALEAGQFSLVYQPVIELKSQRVMGVEALLRWNRGRRLPIGPDVFIPVAEEAGLMRNLTRCVLDILARDAGIICAHLPETHFAVNFSASDLTRSDLAEDLANWSARADVPLDRFILEATERALIDIDKATGQFQRLRAAGVRIAIDDFGTGYSNLAYLTRLEVDYLKVDRLFVQALGTSAATNQVAQSIVAMARQLGLRTVAEGIETAEQAEQVAALGCDYAQGYHYARPMSLADLCRWLQERGERASKAA